MILTCPACATRYLVDPAALGPLGRTVRCARCAETWHQASPDDAPPPIVPPMLDEASPSESVISPSLVGPGASSISDQPMPSFIGNHQRLGSANLPALPQPKSRFSRNQVGWAALAAFVILLVLGLSLFRQGIVEIWPAAGRLYAVFGVKNPGSDLGLDLRGVSSVRSTTDDQPSLVVAGEIVNTSSTVRPVPKLRLSLRNAHGEVITSSDFLPGRDQLKAGETMPFQTSVAAPPANAVSALVTFVTD
jgi:predicted Zn finger-like uncharacterized protein